MQEAELFYFQMQKHLELDLVQVESIDFAIRHPEVQQHSPAVECKIMAMPNAIPGRQKTPN